MTDLAVADDARRKSRPDGLRLAAKSETLLDDNGQLRSEQGRHSITATATGWARSVGRATSGAAITPATTAELTNAIQKFFVEESRLGIPVVFHEECLHGQAASTRTSFSQPIGLAPRSTRTWSRGCSR